jgi:hypothetical protein
VKIAFQKPYSPSLGAGSLRTTVLETFSPDHRYTSTNGMKYPWWRNSGGGKNLDVLVVSGSLLLVPWRPHIFIGKTHLGLQCI